MPLGTLRTFTNMGGEVKPDEEWKVYDDGITPSDPTMIEMGVTKPAARVPQTMSEPKKTSSKPKKLSQRKAEAEQKAAAKKRSRKPKPAQPDAAIEAANQDDLAKRNIKTRKSI